MSVHWGGKARKLILSPDVRHPIGFLIGVALVAGLVSPVLPAEALPFVLMSPFLIGYFVLGLVRFDLAVLGAIFLAPLVPTAIGLGIAPSLPQITLQRVMLLSLYTALIFGVAAKQFVLRLPRLSRWVWLAVVFYLVASMASGLFTTQPLKSVYRILATVFDNVGLFAVIAIAAVSRRDGSFVRKALFVLWISFTVLALIGLIDTLTGFNLLYYLPSVRQGAFTPVYRLGIRRGQGFLPHSTALSIVTAQGAVLTMLVTTWRKKSASRRNVWPIMLIHIAALVGTMTRTGWFVFVVGCILWLLLARRTRTRLLLIVLGALGLLAVMGIGETLYSVVVSGLNVAQQNEVSTLFSRIQWATIVWDNVRVDKIRLLFGFGPGSVAFLTSQWSYPGFRANLTTEYLIRLAEGGMVGLSSFVLLLVVSVGQCRRLIRSSSDPETRNVGVFLLVAFMQMILGSTTLPLFVWAQTTYLFWILLGLVVTIRALDSKRFRKPDLAIQAIS